ncbi:MAG: bacterial Ig-like domain-containing protein [Clostridia bacterium]|nr:bacterial Ig-like domain-containing protein [Clostridia bacterium]
MKKTKGCIRFLSAMLSLIIVVSLACVGTLADTTVEPGTTSPTVTTSPTETTTNPSVTTSVTTGATTTTTPPTTTAPSTEATTPPEIISASLDLGEYKKDYFSGETFDPSNIYVVLSYIGLPSKRIALSEFGNYSPKTLQASDKKVTVKVNEVFSLDVPVTVSNVEVSSVDPSFDSNFKSKYLQGEKFDANGISLKVTYTNGKTETVSDPSKFTVTPSGALSDEKLVVLSYGGQNISVRISVTPVSSITVTPKSTPLVFGQFQDFEKSRVTVTANYAGGETRVVDDYEVENGGFETTGDGTIEIKYYGATAKLNVSVVELTGIRVSKKPTKTSYNEGEYLISEGLEVSGIYTINGNTEERPLSGYTVHAEKLIPNPDNECEISVNYNDMFEDFFTVEVSPIVKLNITTPPTKLSYYEGELFDITGIVVQAEFENGSKLDNFTEYSVPSDSLYVNASKLPVIQYGSVSANVQVNVIAIKAIGVLKNPNRVTYTEGEIFDPTGIEITAEYADGTFKNVEIGACTFPTEPLKRYDTSVTVKYKDFSYSVNIIVSDKIYAKALDAVTLPNTTYVSGQTLSLDGIKLVLSLSNGQTETIPLENVTVSPEAGSQLFSGVDTEIVITYLYNNEQEVTCTIPITVSDKAIVSLIVTKNPNKMTYNEGDIFDPAGMTVKAVYNDNTIEEISNYSVTNTPFILDKSEAQEVYVFVSVGASETGLKVTVNPTVIAMISVTTPPIKVSYNPGEYFDPTGMVVKVTYASGKSYTLSDNMYEIVNNGALKAGDSVITLKFRDKTTALSISVSGDVSTPGNDTTTESTPITTPDVTTPDVTTTPDEPKDPTTPEETTTVPGGDTTHQSGNKKVSGIKIIFICLVLLIVALIVVLVIYYRRHFC